MLKSKQRKLNNESISIKLIPSDIVKYLGLHLYKYLSWDVQFNQLSKKLSRANGILSKLRHFMTKQTLISVYYSLFYSHLLYGCPVWSLTKKENLDLNRSLNQSLNQSPAKKVYANNKFCTLQQAYEQYVSRQ